MKHIRLITALFVGMIAVGGIGIVPYADEIEEEIADTYSGSEDSLYIEDESDEIVLEEYSEEEDKEE